MSDTPPPDRSQPGAAPNEPVRSDPAAPELPTTVVPIDPLAPEPTPGVFDPGSVPDLPAAG